MESEDVSLEEAGEYFRLIISEKELTPTENLTEDDREALEYWRVELARIEDQIELRRQAREQRFVGSLREIDLPLGERVDMLLPIVPRPPSYTLQPPAIFYPPATYNPPPRLVHYVGQCYHLMGPFELIKRRRRRDDAHLDHLDLENVSRQVCSVCLDNEAPFGDYFDEDQMIITNCGHAFHKRCFNQLLNSTIPEEPDEQEQLYRRCPHCRAGIDLFFDRIVHKKFYRINFIIKPYLI